MTIRISRAGFFTRLISLSVATAAILAMFSSVSSQNGVYRSLDLKTAVDKALDGNPITKIADSRIKIADSKIKEAATSKRPAVSFSQSIIGSNNPVFVFGSKLEQGRFGPADFSIDSLNNPNGLFNFRTQVNASIPLFDQRQARSGVALAETERRQTVLMAEAARQQLRYDVIRAYYGVVLERDLVKVAADAVKTAEANRKQTFDMVEVGMTTEADFLAAEVELANTGQRKLEAESQLITTLASLNLAIGEKPDTGHALTGELHERFFPIEEQPDLIRIALENRPDYQRALLDAEKSRIRLRSVRDLRLPRVDAFGNFGYSSPYIANGSTDYTVGINLTYNLVDPGRKARTERAVEEEALAGLELQNLENQIRLDVIRAVQSVRTSEAKIKVSIKSIAQSKEALRIVEDRYRIGLTTFTEVLRSGTALVRARQDLLNNRYEYYLSYARLLLATGRLDDVRWFS